jgi:hypothetical protein
MPESIMVSDLQNNDNRPSSQSTEESAPSPIKSIPLLGYFISVGTTSCRLFQVIDSEQLKDVGVKSYDIRDPKNNEYLDGVIRHVQELLSSHNIGSGNNQVLLRLFVDYNFEDNFTSTDVEKQDVEAKRKDFIREFYRKTGLFFNILNRDQTIDNLKGIFGNTLDNTNTAIINICSNCVDVFVWSDGSLVWHSLEITLSDVEKFVQNSGFPDNWTDQMIETIKQYIRGKMGSKLDGVNVNRTIIIKDELWFMRAMVYPLQSKGGELSLSQEKYRQANRTCLFQSDYKQTLETKLTDKSQISRLYGFKFGHIIIETILDKIGSQKVIPKNVHSIHGSSLTTYVFNVVLSGSTNHVSEGISHMFQVSQILNTKDLIVLSPKFTESGNLLSAITLDTEYEHLKEIDGCDVLLVCNKGGDGYLGESTKCEIFYAYALKKTIAFLKTPTDDQLPSFIPNECWQTLGDMIE